VYLDIDFYESPTLESQRRLEAVDQALEGAGFRLLSREQANEEATFIVRDGIHEIPDIDPRWADDEFEPPEGGNSNTGGVMETVASFLTGSTNPRSYGSVI
jgi:hypothetical protein